MHWKIKSKVSLRSYSFGEVDLGFFVLHFGFCFNKGLAYKLCCNIDKPTNIVAKRIELTYRIRDALFL